MCNKVVTFINKNGFEGKMGNMGIGNLLEDRMKSLDISATQLADSVFLDEADIDNILENKVTLNQVDSFDLDLISQALYCKPNYFSDPKIREKDLINSSLNRGISDISTNTIKGRIQQLVNDFDFLRGLMKENC